MSTVAATSSSTSATNIYGNASGYAPGVNADGTVNAADSNTTVSQDQFLQLLVTQLQNQDPTSPTDETQMLAQLAQFSSLSETEKLNTTTTSADQFSEMAQSAGLIGKTVTAGTSTSPVTGVVSSVSVSNNVTYLDIGGQNVDASTVSSVQNTSGS